MLKMQTFLRFLTFKKVLVDTTFSSYENLLQAARFFPVRYAFKVAFGVIDLVFGLSSCFFTIQKGT